MKISVFGLGYVGTVTAGCLAALGHDVIGVDVNALKVEMINEGRSPVIEKDIDNLIKDGVRNGKLRAVSAAEEAALNSELSMVCVGTPSAGNGNLDLKFVERVCTEIGSALRLKASYHTVVIRSTMLPGSMEEVVIPALEKASGYRLGDKFGVAYNPEFLREGTSVEDFYHPPFTVIGQRETRDAEALAQVYEAIQAPVLMVPLRVAEMVKYANNSFHALKVCFANEIGRICKCQGIDSHQVMEIFCMDHKLNLSPYYLKPAFAFGGSCLPKDVRALVYNAHHLDLQVPVLEAILPSNELHLKQGYEMVRQTGCKKIGVLGMSFKAGTDDLRESPMVELIEMLIGRGYHVAIYDHNVTMSQLYGVNKEYIEQSIPHISTLMRNTIEDVLAESEVIVIGNRAHEFASVSNMLRNGQVIIDFTRIIDEQDQLLPTYNGICW